MMNPWDWATDVYFETGERVVIDAQFHDPLGNETGIIGGIAFDHVVKNYIVILDKPIDTPWLPTKRALAVVIPNGYLRPVTS